MGPRAAPPPVHPPRRAARAAATLNGPVLGPSHRLVFRLEIANRPGMFAGVARVIGEHGCSLGAIDLVEATPRVHVRDVTVDAPDEETGRRLGAALRAVEGVHVRNVSDRVFLMHLGGKIAVTGRVSVRTRDDLSLIYTPGVARICRAIAEDPERAWTLTVRGNAVAIITDGSAILGLGALGPAAAMPVMEGKALLFADLAGISAFPLVLDARSPDEIIETVVRLAPGFGGINLEDIAAPACFEIERALRERLDIPVFHDDQHGTAIVVLAGLRNALAVTGLDLEDARIVVNGAGAAGIATARLLRAAGAGRIALCDRSGVVDGGRQDLNAEKRSLLDELGEPGVAGGLAEAIVGAHVFIGLSGPGALTRHMLLSMGRPRIVFALANPDPEIDPLEAGDDVDVIATGRSDYPNQVNNALAFPGVFRGLLDARATGVSTEIAVAAADALARVVPADVRSSEYILPSIFDAAVVPAVAHAVTAATRAAGLARRVQPDGASRQGDQAGTTSTDSTRASVGPR